ncbi:MAG: transcriptional antiterminator RfaH [Halioglobus sp.]|jgi:transcriptional antiterminator RfaH
MSVCNTNWFAVYTKSRQEHLALFHLENQSFESYLPLAESAGKRKKARPEPLFPRYLFLNADPKLQNLGAVRSTRGVTGLVRAGVELLKIPESIIVGLKERINPITGLISVDSAGLNNGDKVRVCDGPFATMEGVFKEHQGDVRSLMLLDILGRTSVVSLDAELLQRVN